METNQRFHRATGKAPKEALKEEGLKPLPAIPYRPYRVISASMGKTALKVASHQRCFERKQKREDPTHRKAHLTMTQNFKAQRIYELLRKMDRRV